MNRVSAIARTAIPGVADANAAIALPTKNLASYAARELKTPVLRRRHSAQKPSHFHFAFHASESQRGKSFTGA
jgi:hypothetical protein